MRPVPKAEALAADEMWLSSSTKEVLAVTTVDGKPFAGGKPGPALPEDARDLPGARSRSGALTRAARALSVRRHRACVVPKRPWWNTRPGAVAALAGLDLADEQHVVAGAMPRVVAAFEPRDAAVDQRRIGAAQPVRDAVEAVGVRPREPARELDLVVREHVDRVALGVLEARRGSSARRSRLHTTSGGSSDTELNEFAVKPT